MTETQEINLTDDIKEKMAYVERIDKKAKDENITIKYAIQKLGGKVWSYYKYKADIQSFLRGHPEFKRDDGQSGKVAITGSPVELTITVSDEVMAYLEKEAEGYATDAGIVAQLLLHDCVHAKIAKAKSST